MSENHRQVEAWERDVLADLRVGDVERAPGVYAAHDRIEESGETDAVLDRWWDARQRGADVLLLAGRRDQVTALNRGARARLQAVGTVGPDRCVLAGVALAVGDEIVTLRNDYRLA